MFMKKRFYAIVLFVFIILISFTTVGFVYAWFIDLEKETVDLSGNSSGAYFYDGDGSQNNPYLIADKRHMYNLVWLQNNGRFVDENGNQKKYYFKLYDISTPNGLNGSIDMSSIIIPPIGNDTYPFISEFDGNGCRISNLIVSTNFDVIYNGELLKNNSYKFSNSVGLFGLTGTNSVVKNFILNDPAVEVYSDDNNYSTASNKVAGIAVGHVENKAASIGVIGGTLSNQRNDNYSTYNSILGGMSETAQNNMNVTGSVSGSGSDRDKGYFIADDLYENATKLTNIYSSSQFTSYYWLIPNVNQNVSSNLELGSFSAVGSKSAGDKCYEINSGTAITNFTFYPNPIQFNDSSSTNYDKNCVTPILYGAESSQGINIDMTKANITDLDSNNTKDEASILANLVSPKSEDADKRIYGLKYYWRFKNSPQTYPVTVSSVVDENNTLLSTATNYNINDACLRVNISHASESNPANIFLIAQTANTSADRYIGLKQTNTFNAGEQFNYEDYKTTGGTKSEIKISKNYPDQALRLPKTKEIVGCYFTVTTPGVYCMFSTNSAVAFLYVSVVGVAEGQESTGSYSDELMISGVDFVSNGTSIKQDAGTGQYDFISSTGTYVYTKVKISYESNMNGVVLYFKRENDTISSLLLVVYPNTDGLTKSGSGTCNPQSTNINLVIGSTGITSTKPTFT